MERVNVQDNQYLTKVIERAISVLGNGGIIVYPTDTLYGIGVDALNTGALQNVFTVKGREEQKPLSVLVSDLEMADIYVHISPFAKKVMKRLLPGPYTFLLPRKDTVPDALVAGGRVLGIRIPDSELCRELSRRFGRLVTATSANISGAENKLTIDKILTQFGPAKESIDLVIDGGSFPPSLGSTVIDLSGDSVVIVREGDAPTEKVIAVTEAVRKELS